MEAVEVNDWKEQDRSEQQELIHPEFPESGAISRRGDDTEMEATTGPSSSANDRPEFETHCCRLCAVGANPENDQNDNEEKSFLPLYDLINDDKEPLCLIINRYLPIQVSATEAGYPTVICNPCKDSLINTVEFFNKIEQGQRMFASLLKQIPLPRGKSKSKKVRGFRGFRSGNPLTKNTKEKEMSTTTTPPSNNPGRKSRNRKTQLEQILEPDLILEPRVKRKSKPPTRYSDVPEIQEIQEIPGPTPTSPDPASTSQIPCPSSLSSPSELVGMGGINVEKHLNAFDATESSVENFGTDFISVESQPSNLNTNSDNLLLDVVGVGQEFNFDDDDPTENIINETENPNEAEADAQSVEEDENKDATVTLGNLLKDKDKINRRKRRRRKMQRKNQPVINCEKCPRTFHRQSSLAYHMLCVHEHNKFPCNICGRVFRTESMLESHASSVHSNLEEKETTFACAKCPANFKTRSSMYTHRKKRHSKAKHVCQFCGDHFTARTSLLTHIRRHKGEKPHSCDICDKKFTQRSTLVEHRRTHTGEKPYKCDQCEKSFKTASQNRSHKLTHTIVNARLCQVCGKGFNSMENFKYHMRRHNNSERPLECTVCEKRFAESWALRRHVRLHTGEKPYECEICKRVFSDPSNFQKHRSLHSNSSSSLHVPTTSSTTSILEEDEDTSDDDKGKEYSNMRFCESLEEMQTFMDTVEDNPDNDDKTNDILSDHSLITENVDADAGSSIVHILNSAENVPPGERTQQESSEQVIYVYSGDGPLFTFSMTDEHQSHPLPEAPSDAISNLEDVEVGGFDGSFETLNAQDFESHYYLQTVGENTIAVPIQNRASTASLLSQLNSNVTIEVEGDVLPNPTTDTSEII